MNRPNVDIVRLDNNLGKTFAVLQALKYVDTENVFLCDSDLNNLDNEEISNAIAKYDLLNLNMLILRRLNINFFPKIIRSDTLLSGERILRKMDLIKVIKSGVKGYQLEVAINQYFIDNGLQRNCYWSPSSAVNNYKFKKINFFKGVFKDVKMHVNLIRYIGIVNFTKQVFSFCKQNV